jgi:hypothetical protein
MYLLMMISRLKKFLMATLFRITGHKYIDASKSSTSWRSQNSWSGKRRRRYSLVSIKPRPSTEMGFQSSIRDSHHRLLLYSSVGRRPATKEPRYCSRSKPALTYSKWTRRGTRPRGERRFCWRGRGRGDEGRRVEGVGQASGRRLRSWARWPSTTRHFPSRSSDFQVNNSYTAIQTPFTAKHNSYLTHFQCHIHDMYHDYGVQTS